MNRVVFSFGKCFFKKVVFSIIVFISIFILLCQCFSVIMFDKNIIKDNAFAKEVSEENVLSNKKFPELKDIINDFFGKEKKNGKKEERKVYVYPGGYPLGFALECAGVIVVALGKVTTEWGETKPIDGKNIKVGDIVHSINC